MSGRSAERRTRNGKLRDDHCPAPRLASLGDGSGGRNTPRPPTSHGTLGGRACLRAPPGVRVVHPPDHSVRSREGNTQSGIRSQLGGFLFRPEQVVKIPLDVDHLDVVAHLMPHDTGDLTLGHLARDPMPEWLPVRERGVRRSQSWGTRQRDPRVRSVTAWFASRIKVAQLVEAGLLQEGEKLIMYRRGAREPRQATVSGDGFIVLADGRTCKTPSEAACAAAQVGSTSGWIKWRVPRLGNATLNDVRTHLRVMMGTPVYGGSEPDPEALLRKGDGGDMG
jgi:Restriction Enzyme Adenine Methylase Associated